MFGKKQSTPKAPWAGQLLTTEYLVDGNMDGDGPTGPWFLHVQAEDLAMATLTLTQARYQATGNLNVTLPTAAKWILPSTAMFVAVIPRDEGSSAYALKRNSSSRNPIPAVVFVGPYAIRGTSLSPDPDLDILSGYQTFAMQPAVIDCLVPGARDRAGGALRGGAHPAAARHRHQRVIGPGGWPCFQRNRPRPKHPGPFVYSRPTF